MSKTKTTHRDKGILLFCLWLTSLLLHFIKLLVMRHGCHTDQKNLHEILVLCFFTSDNNKTEPRTRAKEGQRIQNTSRTFPKMSLHFSKYFTNLARVVSSLKYPYIDGKGKINLVISKFVPH